MKNLLPYYEFLLESARVDEGILKSWNENKLIAEIKMFLKRYNTPVFLKNLKNQETKNKLILLQQLYDKYEAGDESVKPQLIELGNFFLDKKKAVTGYSMDPIIKTKYHG